MIPRKAFLAGAAALPSLLWLPASAKPTALTFERIESELGGRLGVAYRWLPDGTLDGYRTDERFPMCSTFKFVLVACVLSRVDRRSDSLDDRVSFTKADVLEYAPAARAHLAQGSMTVRELCAAAVTLSDNTATNLLITRIGGPHALTQWLRAHGDATTRLDRFEPDMSEGRPGDVRDTTTPAAMVANVERFVFGPLLSPASRALLQGWMLACETGKTLLRAGLPSSYRVGDKTGMGGPHNAHGDSSTRNDVAFALDRAARTPRLIVAVYTRGIALPAQQRDAAIASIASAFAW